MANNQSMFRKDRGGNEMKKISIVAMSVAILLLIGSCAQRNGSEEAITKPTTPVTKVTPTPTPTVTVTPTTNPNAKPVPGSCLVLEERYCKTVTFVTVKGYLIAAYKLPVGTPIFSLYGGLISVATIRDVVGGQVITDFGSFTTVKTGKKKTDCLCGTDTLDIWHTGVVIGGNKFLAGEISQINKGQILVRAGETNLTIDPSFDMLNIYNLIMYFTIGDNNPDNAKTKAMFGISQL